jgi:hypothetical protein
VRAAAANRDWSGWRGNKLGALEHACNHPETKSSCYGTAVRRDLVILAAIGFLACQAPQAVDRAVNSPNVARSGGGANGGGARGSGGRAGTAGGADGSNAGSGGDSSPGLADAAPDPTAPTPPPPVGGGTAMDAAATLLPQGQACAANGACASGICVDGFCCNSICDGPCQACNVVGNAGTCTPVPPGQDPDDECAMDAPTTCKRNGTCDGQGACGNYPAGAQCLPGSCSAGVEQASGTCDGKGQCLAGATLPCKSGVCDGSSCGSTCATSAQCQPGFFCDGTSCRIKLAMAAACTSDPQCGSGHCVDHVCCASDCAQTCSACNLPGSIGSCTAVADGQDPDKECPAEAAGTCGRGGGCNGRGSCKFQPSGTSCGAGTCTDGVETSARSCNGGGLCQTATTKPCGTFACKGTACATSCTTAADCKAGLTCADGVCVMPPVAKLGSLKVNDTANAGQWSAQKNFQIGTAGVRPWSDWPNSYIASMEAAANVLLGADWVKVAAESKKYNGGPQASVTLGAQADVYLAVDDRWGDKPAWLIGWTNTGWKLQVQESATKAYPFTLYVKVAQTGTLTVPAINNNDGYDYFIVVK